MRARRANARGNTDNCPGTSLAHCYLYARLFSLPTQEATLIIAEGPFASLLQVLKPTRRHTQETTLSVVWRISHYALVFTVFIWTVSSFLFHLPDNTVNCRGTFLFDII